MKKLALVFGLVLVLTGMAAAGAAYFVYRQVSPVVAQFADFRQIAEIERGVRKRGFHPLPTAELTERQVQQLVQVQQELRRRLGEHMKTFEARYREVAGRQNATLADAPAVLQAYGDLAKAWLDAKRTQIEALNAADLSLEEYRWIRHEAYLALGRPLDEVKGAVRTVSPESNRKLIERVKKLLEENLALVAFGL